MEASAPATAAPRSLPLLTSPPRFLRFPLCNSARGYGRSGEGGGGGGGLLLRPPPRRRQEPGARMRRALTCCCFLSGGRLAVELVDGGSLVAAAALLAALQVLWLRWRGDSPQFLIEDDNTIVNKAQGTTEAVYSSNCGWYTQHDNEFWEPYVFGRMTVDEIDSRACSLPCVNSVHKETHDYSGVTPLTSLDTSVYISRPDVVSCSTATANTSHIEMVTGAHAMAQSVLGGQDESNYFSTRLGRVAGLPHQFLSLSGRKKVIENYYDQKPVGSEGVNLFEHHQSNQEENLDLTSLSSLKKIAKNHNDFVPHASNSSLFEPRKAIRFRYSYPGVSFLSAGHFFPVSCLKEGPLSEQKKSFKGHENATAIGLNLSKVLNKEHSDNSAPPKKGGVKGKKDALDYLRIYNSFLIDGRLKDCVDLLESMEQKGLLDMKKAKDWKKALQLYEEIKSINLTPTVSMMNALITSLCGGDQVSKALDVLDDMNRFGLRPNEITYSILFVACERNCEAQQGLHLLEQLKFDGIDLNPTIVGCLTGLCLKMFDNDLSLGNIIVKFNLGKPQIDNKWTSAAIRVYREAISAGLLPSSDVLSQVLGCLRLPHDRSLKDTFIENMGISCDIPKHPNVNSLFEGFGEYDIRAFSILEEAASLGAVESFSMEDSRIVIDARKSQIYTVEVSLLTTLRSLKHRLAAGARLPNVTILIPTEKRQVDLDEREKTLKLAGRIGQAVGALLRRLGISYQGEESHGRMRINGLTLRRWFNPKLQSTSASVAPADLLPLPSRLAKGIADQQREIRNLSLD